MSIAKRVEDAIEKLTSEDADGALIPCSIAIDATAQKIYGKPGRGSFKGFIRDNMKLITRIAFNGTTIENLNLNVPQRVLEATPEMKTNSDGLCGVDEILYHVVRCGLLHQATLPQGFHIHFQDRGGIKVENDHLEISGSIILGLLIAVVCSSVNNHERPTKPIALNMSSYDVPINKL